MAHKVVTEEEYYQMLGNMPPIYFGEIDGIVASGFVSAEPYSNSSKGITFIAYYFKEDQYFKTMVTLQNENGEAFLSNNWFNMSFRGNKAFTYERPTRPNV